MGIQNSNKAQNYSYGPEWSIDLAIRLKVIYCALPEAERPKAMTLEFDKLYDFAIESARSRENAHEVVDALRQMGRIVGLS